MDCCTNCPYNKFPRIRQTPWKDTTLAIVGEAPGIVEISKNTPFMGPAGQLLQKALISAGLPSTSEIFLTNALLCMPPKNKTNIKTAIRNCRERLLQELKEVNPTIVIALGNIAMHALTNDFNLKITREQGRVLEVKELPGVKIIPMLHPAAILRAPGDYKLFYGTMRYAGQLFRGEEELDPGEVSWQEIDTDEKFDKALAIMDKVEYLGADIETTGLNPYEDKVLVLGVCFKKNCVFVFPPKILLRRMKDFHKLKSKWIWHNGKFDTSFIDAPFHHDTMLLSYCLNEQGGVHSLEQLSSRLLGADPYKHLVKEKIGKGNFGDLSKEDLYRRVAMDCDYTLQIFKKLYSQVSRNPNTSRLYQDVLIPASSFLKRVEHNGIYIDKPLLKKFEQEYQINLEEIQGQIIDMAMPFWNPDKYMRETGRKTAPDVFSPGSTYQVAWLLFDVLKLKHRLRGKKRSTDKEVLESLRGQHPIIDLLLEYRSVAKELSTYIIGVDKYVQRDGRVHTTFKLHGTVTGRLSSSEPNVQNQPKRKPKIRNIFKAPDNHILIEADYKGAELRVLAQISRDPALMKCFAQGRDLHTEVQEALHIPRIRAKAVNFGIAYGRTEFSIAEEFDISVEEARSYIEMWFNRFPKAKEFMDMCANAPLKGNSLSTPFGRQRRFGLVLQDNIKELQNESRNFIIQSVASDLTLLSAIRVEKDIERIGGKIINLVHDSILIEIPNDVVAIKQAMELLGNTMREVPKELLKADVPFEVEFSIGTAWGSLEEVSA